MLFARSIITISCIIFSVVNAAPIIPSTSSSSKSYSSEAGFLLTESLSEYYENIVDQAMLDVSENVLTFLPQSISHGNVEGSFLLFYIYGSNHSLTYTYSSSVGPKINEP